MKYDWKKEEKEIYMPKAKPEIRVIDKQKYIMIDGEGNPNEEAFAKRVEALYAVAYGIRMAPRSNYEIKGYYEYGVYPLEGIWSTKNPDNVLDKSQYTYTIMIRQPAFVTQHVFEEILEKVKIKKKLPLLEDVRFEEMEDGEVVQMMHQGTYDDEPASFALMKEYMKEQGYKQRCFEHREIYLNDARRVSKDKLKTVLRYFIRKI
ncbi:hypothetical protein M2475_001717 [Breznakia sp. PF5-3]|nr:MULTISPECIES: GyrI-like domain-containing protein [unclassified Breznakia]MDF9836141.1 hypothetical protein [Breznakia sp. PF5-3]MDF9838172.1 hypothetical protein [Breznakia sp. PFB2-8]MDF9860158.1 hypothetical protein [Breznakia sp. PH5-24]